MDDLPAGTGDGFTDGAFVGPPPDANPSLTAEEDSAAWDALVSVVSLPFQLFIAPFEAASSVAASGASVITGAQDTASGIADTVAGVYDDVTDTAERVLNPLGLAGLGIGLSVGSIVTVVGLGVGTAAIVDELFAGGAGRIALAERLRGRR